MTVVAMFHDGPSDGEKIEFDWTVPEVFFFVPGRHESSPKLGGKKTVTVFNYAYELEGEGKDDTDVVHYHYLGVFHKQTT